MKEKKNLSMKAERHKKERQRVKEAAKGEKKTSVEKFQALEWMISASHSCPEHTLNWVQLLYVPSNISY